MEIRSFSFLSIEKIFIIMLKKYLLAGLGFLSYISPSQAQNKLSPDAGHYLLTRSVRPVRSGGEQRVNAYLCLEKEADFTKLCSLGVSVNLNLGDILTVQVPADSLEALSRLPFVRYVQMSVPVRPMMDKAREAAGADLVASGKGLDRSYTGEGVVVGVIDGGFDYTHPAFFDSEGKTLRIRRVWEQSYTGGTPPEGFAYGAEFDSPSLILAAGGDVSTNSHGTHVTGIAAGASLGNGWQGVAADADIVLVSMGELAENSANISDAIAYIYRYAESVGKPCVINMSLGTQIGPHDGTSVFDRVADRLQGPGRLLVGSSGNFGHEKIHVSRTFSGAEAAPLRTFFDFKQKPTTINYGGQVDVWGEKDLKYDIQAVVVSTSSGQVIASSPVMDASAAGGSTEVFELTKNSKGQILISTEVNPLNGKPHTLLTLNVTNLRSGYAAGLVVTPRSAGTLHAWADDVYVRFTDAGVEGWQDGDSDCSIAEIGGTGDGIISVGAYTTRNAYTPAGSTREETTGEVMGAAATFSGRGPRPDGRVKPDIAAPGTMIASAVSSHDATLTSLPMAGAVERDGKAYPYAYMQGTSMAAPFVAGVLATWLQAAPELDPSAVRGILSSSAVRDEFTGTLSGEGNGTWGRGKMDAYEGLKRVLRETGISAPLSSSALPPVLRYDGQFLRILFPGDATASSLSVSLHDLSGRVLFSTAVPAVAGSECTIPAGGLPDGCYLLQVGSRSYKFRK